MLAQATNNRTLKSNLLLASSTASTAGMTNVAGVLGCYAFTSNVTGHTAAFAEQLLLQNWEEMWVVLGWVLLFLFGAFLSHFLIRSFERKSVYFAHALPLAIVAVILAFVGWSGLTSTNESEAQTIFLASALVLAMGMQNSAVSVISGGGIKVTHLTGLFTDLGGELSEWIHPNTQKTAVLKQKLTLRFTILTFYLLGGILGGWFYLKLNFVAFFVISGVLLTIVFYDAVKAWIPKKTID